jgi:hypothetical protein
VPNIESRCNQLELGHPPKGLLFGKPDMCRTFAAPSARLRVPLLGYERNLGADAVQENQTKPSKIQQIGAFELGGFGSYRTGFSHRKGIGMPCGDADRRRTDETDSCS